MVRGGADRSAINEKLRPCASWTKSGRSAERNRPVRSKTPCARRTLDRVTIASGADLKFEPRVVAVDLVGERLIVEPDELARRSDGSLVLRRVRTGYRRTDEKTRVDYQLYHLAGRASKADPGTPWRRCI